MWNITMAVNKQQIKPGTKTVWEDVENYKETITEEQYKNCTSKDTMVWFKNLGGKEYADRGYTPFGYVINKLVSTSPDKQKRTIRTFDFIWEREV